MWAPVLTVTVSCGPELPLGPPPAADECTHCVPDGAPELTERQLAYAANDVAYLHRLKEVLDTMLAREHRTELAKACFDFLPTRVELDLKGWPEVDIFAH